MWDDQAARRPWLSQVLAECGAQPQWLDAPPPPPQTAASAHCSIALVALAAPPSASRTALAAVRTLQQCGFRVVSYAPGAQAWPLGWQCQALLAGATSLLDSARPTFAQELRQTLAELWWQESARWSAEQQLQEALRASGVIGASEAMRAVFRTALQYSPLSDLPVLLTGETGTGKELIARAIHQHDPKRRTGPFIALNCAALSPHLAESELFGHRRGAFTGAEQHRQGLFRAAQGGVLFLDEIGELELPLQAKLLRVLQERRVLGVGEEHEVAINVRVIIATHRDLPAMVTQGSFRADLYHRLNVLPLELPPLRARREEIKPLCEHFVAKWAALAPAGAPPVGEDFIAALLQLSLPGNVRELENLVRRALLNKRDSAPLGLRDLPPEIWQQLTTVASDTPPTAGALPRTGLDEHLTALLDEAGWSLEQSLAHCEKLLLRSALRRTRGNQAQSAQLLKITPRSVYNKIQKHKLPR